MKQYLVDLKTLVMMQLKDKLNLSFLQSKRSTILTVTTSILKMVIVTAIFFLLFYLCIMFSVFSFAKYLPDTVINVLFTVVEVFAIVSCTVGLTKTLYLSLDNKVLLTLPVTNSQIFLSKLALFYVFELKRNVMLTLPMFIAYGIVNSAVWYYYVWLLFGFILISLVPVLFGAILSIPALYVGNFVRKYKWLQLSLIVVAVAFLTWLVVALIAQIPANINILGQWGQYSRALQKFLINFRDALIPFYWLCILVIGGTSRISTTLFGWDSLLVFVGVIAVCTGLFFACYYSARPLFFKMASKQFEYEKATVAPRKNKKHAKWLSPYMESITMDLRSTRRTISILVELVLPFVVILFLNKLYAAMSTNYAGQTMTRTFNVLVLLVTITSFNSAYASSYSREGHARNILKTRPQSIVNTLFARIALRCLIIIVSTIAATKTYAQVAGVKATEQWLLTAIAIFVGIAHLLWSAELDVMNSQADQYHTLGVDFSDPNEAKSTALSIVISILFAGMFFLFSDTGTTVSLIKGAIWAAVLLAARIYLYVVRIKLYFVEN